MLGGRDEGRTLSRAKEASIEGHSTNLNEILAGGYDLVTIALPWSLHNYVHQLAVDGGSCSHLLVEHPVCLSAAESHRLSKRAMSLGRRTLVNFPTRFLSPVLQLRSLLSSGQVGSVFEINHNFSYPNDEEHEWLQLIATHSLDVADWLFGLDELLECSMSVASRGSLDGCPTWSWPLRVDSFGLEEAISVEWLRASISTKGAGRYQCRFGHHDDEDFTETLVVRGEFLSAGYRTWLRRENEFSQWKISKLWTGSRNATPSYSEEQGPRSDAWFEAHVRQAIEIAVAVSDDQRSTPLASFVDAARTQDLIERIIAHAALRQ